jgi:hypothetical protein
MATEGAKSAEEEKTFCIFCGYDFVLDALVTH